MKTNELKELIRPLIVEELQKQLPKLLFEMLSNQNKTVIKETVYSTKKAESNPISSQSAKPKKVIKNFVKDPILNQILNETTPGLPQTPYGLDDTTDNISDDFKNEMRNILEENIDVQPVSVPTNPIEKLFNKDFKAILNKSKTEGNKGNFSNKMLQSW